MPQLVRLRFVSLGHPNARFDDLMVDLRDAEGAATDSTLWLRNGGGKSSLLNLIFGLIRPARRDFLGSRAEARKRRIEDYVGARDHGAVVAEWQLDGSDSLELDGEPQRYLTGVFLEWRRGRREGDTRLRRLFFAGRTASSRRRLDIETLPLFTQNSEGRRSRRTLASFRQEWMALRDRHPHLELAQTEHQGEWAELLDAAGIDPELFGYQIRMNLREGGVDELFRFAEHELFVDFLLELALDPALGERVSRNVKTYKRELRERKNALLPERELLEGIGTRLDPVAALAVERRVMGEGITRIASSIEGLSMCLADRRSTLKKEIEEWRVRGVRERTLSGERHKAHEESKRRAAVLRNFAAQCRHEKAAEGFEQAQRTRVAADRDRRLWDAAAPLYEALRQERRAAQYRDELGRLQAEHAPLLDELRGIANALAGALAYRIDSLRASEREQLTAARTHRDDARAALDSAAGSQERAARAEEILGRLNERIDEARRARGALKVASLLKAAEPVAEALKRCQETLEEIETRLGELHAAVEGGERRTQTLHEERAECLALAREKATLADSMRAALEEAHRARETLEVDPLLCACLEVETIDLERLPEQAIGELERAARVVLEEIVRIRVARAGNDRAVLRLEESGLLPPTLDVERVHDALQKRLRTVWTGWAYIEANVAESAHRRVAVERAPEIAMGVVVRDVDLEAARALIAELNPPPETPVVVAAQSALSAAGEGEATRIVAGPASDGYFDRDSAALELAQRRAQLDEADHQLERHGSEHRSIEALSTRLRAYRDRYPRGWFDAQAAKLRDVEHAVESQRARTGALEHELGKIAEDRQRAGAERDQLENRRLDTRTDIERLEGYIAQFETQLPGWRDEAAAAARARDEALAERAEWTSEAKGLESAAEAAVNRARHHGEDARALSEERLRVDYVDGPIEAVEGRLDELRDRYRQLAASYEQKIGADGLLALQRQAEEAAREQRAKFEPLLDSELTEEVVRASLSTIQEAADLEARRRDAADRYGSAMGSLGNQSQVLERARTRLKETAAACETLGAEVPIAAHEAPAGPVQADEAAREADVQANEHATAADAHTAKADALDAQVTGAEADARQLDWQAQLLKTISEDYADLISVTSQKSEAVTPALLEDAVLAEEIERNRTELKAARQGFAALDERRTVAVRDLRGWIDEPRFEGLKSLVGRRVAHVEPSQLEANAEAWREQISLREKVINEQLSEMDAHRDMIVDATLAAAEDGLRLLRTATRQSRLPETVPTLGGAQFLRVISHEPEDRAERRGRLAELIDEIVDEGELPGGLALVQRAVRKIGRPLRVRVLNPDPDIERKMVDIVDMARFSGGEQLTAAILLYCTLARLRARARGAVRAASTVLILDNPIGRASRVRFLELQRDVAKAMGVQLFYTTAVNDHDALRALPNVIRMRNERVDRRTGHRLVEHVQDGFGHIEAARVVRSQHREVRDPAA